MGFFDHERLDVYQAAVDFVVLTGKITESLPRGRGAQHAFGHGQGQGHEKSGPVSPQIGKPCSPHVSSRNSG